MTSRLTRRTFIELGAAGVVVVAAGGVGVTSSSAASRSDGELRDHKRDDEPFVEADVMELQRLMRRGKLSSSELTEGYLDRIRQLNPTLNAIIETNPRALKIANRMDKERRSGHARGPLHGIPVIVKDNIATDDNMETTAGSLALVGSRVPRDADLVSQLRAAGAVILGKANLSEWANFRGFGSRAGRLYSQPVCPFAGSVWVLVGLGGRGGDESLCRSSRHGNGRIDPVPIGRAVAGRDQADRRSVVG